MNGETPFSNINGGSRIRPQALRSAPPLIVFGSGRFTAAAPARQLFLPLRSAFSGVLIHSQISTEGVGFEPTIHLRR